MCGAMGGGRGTSQVGRGLFGREPVRRGGGLGDRRTMIVNDAQCQGWEVQSGNHSIPDHTRGLYVYVESTLLIYTLYMLRTLLTGRKSRECESQSTSQSSYHKLETVTSVTSSMSSPSATYSPHPVLHAQLTVCCE